MDFRKENGPRIPSESSADACDRHHRSHGPTRESSALRNFLENALVDQVKKLRHHRERCDFPLCQCTKELRRIQSFEINDTGAFHQRQQQVRHLRQHVKKRKHTEHRVLRSDMRPAEYGPHFAHKVGVRQHHSFGIRSSARGIKQRSKIVILRENRNESSPALLQRCCRDLARAGTAAPACPAERSPAESVNKICDRTLPPQLSARPPDAAHRRTAGKLPLSLSSFAT